MASNHQRTTRHGLPAGDAELFTDDVDTGDELSNGVFHLDASVHLEKEELPGGCKKEFNRSGTDVVHRFCRRHGGLTHRLA